MSNRNFRSLLEAKWDEGKFVCVGLDSDPRKIPAYVWDGFGDKKRTNIEEAISVFNAKIVEATRDLVCAYKPNAAFYEAHGVQGLYALERTVEFIQKHAPDVPIILDKKDNDIGNTNDGYVKSAFEHLKADALTVNPYLGATAMEPFLAQADKGIIVLCHTSNPGAEEFQDLVVPLATLEPGKKREEFLRFEARRGEELHAGGAPLYQYVAFRVAEYWNKNGNCALVVGATYPDQLREVRKIVGDMPILLPGFGKQGAKIEEAVPAGKCSRGKGIICNFSSSLIFASDGPDFADAARRELEKQHAHIHQSLTS